MSLPSPRAARAAWEWCGRPPPVEYDGTPVVAHGKGPATPCATCGDPLAPFDLADAFSENFRSPRNLGRMFPYGGQRLCAGCTWAVKTLALRCAAWFAAPPDALAAWAARKGLAPLHPVFAPPTGVWFFRTRPPPLDPADAATPRAPRPDVLALLLDPPAPPFAVGVPLYGIDHGGENHVHRCAWQGRAPEDALPRLQAKHVAILAAVSTARDRYTLQLDDAEPIPVDRALWAGLRDDAARLLGELRAAGVGAEDARLALRELRPPPRCPTPVAAAWPARTARMATVADAHWWPFLIELFPMPALPPRPAKGALSNDTKEGPACPPPPATTIAPTKPPTKTSSTAPAKATSKAPPPSPTPSPTQLSLLP